MKFLFFSLLVLGLACIASAVQFQRDRCAWGPSYWCMSRENAQQCRQVQYCRENFWKPPTKYETPKSCDLCKTVVGYISQLVADNKTKDETKSGILDVCTNLGSYAAECKKLVEDNFDEIWNLIGEGVRPDDICAKLEECDNSMAIAAAVPALPKQSLCEICQLVVTFVEQYLKDNSTEEEAKAAVERLCQILPESSQDQCTSLVEMYFPQIWAFLENEVENGCVLLRLCNSTYTDMKLKEKSKNTTNCELCTWVVDQVDRIVNSSMTEKVAKELVVQACDLLGPVAPECKVLIDMFFDDIWKLIDKELTPQQICVQIKLCSKSVLTSFGANGKSFSIECSACKELIKGVVKLMNTTTAKTHILGLLEEACSLLPNGTDQSECKSFLDEFFPTVWELLIDTVMTPDNICDLFGVCSNSLVSKRRALVPRRALVKSSDTLCELCEELIENLIQPFVDSANETEVKNYVLSLCRDLPGGYASQCTDLVDNYFDLVWSILKQYVDDANSLCELIHACNSTTGRVVFAKVGSSVECTLCKFVAKYIDGLLTKDSTEDEVLNVIEKACSILPSSVSSECETYVEEYGPTLYVLLINEADPDTVCSLIKACTSSMLTLRSSGTLTSGTACEVCEDVLSVIKSLLPGTTDTVVSVLTEACGIMPTSIQSECKSFVNQYGPQLIQLIAKMIDPDKDCQMIGLCSKMGGVKMW